MTKFHQNHTKKEKSELFMRLVEGFTATLFVQTGKIKEATKKDISLEHLVFYLGMLISVDHIKRYVNKSWQRQYLTQYYNTIYRYSHRKMFILSTNKLF